MRDIPIDLSQSAVVVELIVSPYSAPFYVNSTNVYINRKRALLDWDQTTGGKQGN
jgi:hypothetical protein